MVAKNCWEVKKCGREPGGVKAGELGLCSAATDKSYHGTNNGKNGGRSCWLVTGTMCGGTIQGTFAQKEASCLVCDFLKQVKREEGRGFVLKRAKVAS